MIYRTKHRRFNKKLFSKIPENVLVVDWLPQHDLLCELITDCKLLYILSLSFLCKTIKFMMTDDFFLVSLHHTSPISALPNTRLFVSHCGMNGVMESVFHKVTTDFLDEK